MRILLLALDVDLNERQGDSVHLRELVDNLRLQGHKLRIVTGTTGSSGIEDHTVRKQFSIRQILQATHLGRDWADIVYERRMSPKISWAVSLLTGVPFVVEVNGSLDDELRALGRKRRLIRPAIARRIRGQMFSRAARVIAVSSGIRDGLVSMYGLPRDRVAVVPNGANISRFHPKDRNSSRIAVRLDRNDFIICFVGSLVAWQGIPTLIAAAERLRTRIPHLRIVMVGGGPDTDALKAQVWQSSVRDICIFAGEVPYEDVPTIIAASDVCVAPFARTRKASPIKVFEYLACGKPVVSSDIDDIGDFLKRSRAGVVIEPGNAEALANGIEWVYNHPEEALELARRGRLAVEQTRSWEETAKKVSAILESIRIASPS